MVKISTIIPVYNAEKTIQKCIDSLIQQKFEDFEIIIINDGSIDNSATICNSYAMHNDKIKVIHKNNGGVSSARNIGLNNAKGEYITFVDSDDFVEPDYLSILYNSINNFDIAICGYNQIENKIIKQINIAEENITQETLRNNFFNYYLYALICAPWGKIYCLGIIKNNNIKFDERINWGEDFIFNIQYFEHCKNIRFIPDILYNYVLGEGTSTSKHNIDSFSQDTAVINYLLKYLGETEEYFKYCQNIVVNSAIKYSRNLLNNLYNKETFIKKCNELRAFSKKYGKNRLNFKRGMIFNIIKQKMYFLLPLYYKFINWGNK